MLDMAVVGVWHCKALTTTCCCLIDFVLVSLRYVEENQVADS